VETPDLRAGTVTAVQTQQRDAERVSVFVDGAFAFGLALEVAVRAGVRKGVLLSVAEQEALLAEEEAFRARRAALDLIAHRAQTEGEIRRKLARKGFSEAAAEGAVERMRDLGYLDDEAYARAYVRGKHAGSGHGPQRLRADLLRRGVKPATIDAALAEEVADDALLETALEHGRRRWLRLASEPDPRKRQKRLSDFLARRGYGYDVIREVLEAVAREG